MLSAVQANNYDGITVDFEGISAEDGRYLTHFMRELYGNMKAMNKLVAMAVPAKTRDINTGWAGAFTYRDLAPWTDFMILMAYDQHFPGGQPGPIAPIGWMGDVLRYSQQRVDPKKLILGFGMYGYDWNLTTHAQADPRTWTEVQTLAATFGGQFGWSTVDASGSLRYNAVGQQHEVWYENRQSFDAKLALVRANPIAGFALWRLGQEDPGIWQSILAIRSPCDTVAPFVSTRYIWYIRETGHSLQGAFLNYWNAHGGASIFGYPLTEEFQEANPIDGQVYTVQYFERQRFEYHPEARGTPYEVQLGLLGVQITREPLLPAWLQHRHLVQHLLSADRAHAQRRVPHLLAGPGRLEHLRLPADRGVFGAQPRRRQLLHRAILRARPLRVAPRTARHPVRVPIGPARQDRAGAAGLRTLMRVDGGITA